MVFSSIRRRHRSLSSGARDLLRGSSWLIVASVLGQGSMLMASLLVANLLGVLDFGHYALLQTTVLILASIAQISFAVVIAQQVSSLRRTNPALAGEVAGFCLLVASLISAAFTVALVLGRDDLAGFLFRDTGLGWAVACAALALPWTAVAAIQQGLFLGLERFRDQALLSVFTAPAVIAAPAIGAIYWGLGGALLGLAAAYFLRAAIAQLMVVRAFRAAAIRWSFGHWRAKLALLRDYALPATLAGLVMWIATWGGQTLLARSTGGPGALGLFAAAFTVRTIVMFVPTQMVGALLPILARTQGDPAAGSRRSLLAINLGASLFITLILAGLGILVAPLLMSAFGQGFDAGSGALIILLLGTPVEAATVTLYQDIQSRGLFWRVLLWINLPSAVVLLIGGALLVPGGHAEGLALAWVIGWAAGLAGTILAMGRRPTAQDLC